MKTRLRFDDTEFVYGHGRKPRGRGSWAFKVTHVDGHQGEAPVEFSPSTTLTEAKRWMRLKVAGWLLDEGFENAATVDVAILP